VPGCGSALGARTDAPGQKRTSQCGAAEPSDSDGFIRCRAGAAVEVEVFGRFGSRREEGSESARPAVCITVGLPQVTLPQQARERGNGNGNG
jgi:hypothetical protein